MTMPFSNKDNREINIPTLSENATMQSQNEEPNPTLGWASGSFEADNITEQELVILSSESSSTSNNNDNNKPPMNSNRQMPTLIPQAYLNPIERKTNALLILQFICESAIFAPYLEELLSSTDSQGHTPFMLGIATRSYSAALTILNTIQSNYSNSSNFMNMIYPKGLYPDLSPLHMLCCNDTCSFTWTGAEHIDQDIFECRTCGLIGSLCCCTECARVCHRGHDCKLKKTSPTAYCDCWEKCKCKALIMGNLNVRYELLTKLVKIPELVVHANSRGENILLFLVQTVSRQSNEQRQYRSSRSRSANVASSR